jgi:hypothetical protein
MQPVGAKASYLQASDQVLNSWMLGPKRVVIAEITITETPRYLRA